MAVITDPMMFNNGFDGITNEEQFDAYYAPKNGQRANETNVGRAPKRNKKELNIIKDYLSVMFNRPVREYDITMAYQYGEIISEKQPNDNSVAVFYKYYMSVVNDNLGVAPTSDTNLDNSYWVEVEPFGTNKDEFGNDVKAMNDARTGLGMHNSGYFIVGERFGNNIAIDRNEIMARIFDPNTGITNYSNLHLQSDGGNIYIHRNLVDAGNSVGIAFTNNGDIGIKTLQPETDLHIVGSGLKITNPDTPLYTLDMGYNSGKYQVLANGINLNLKSTKDLHLNETGGAVYVGGTNGLGGKFNVNGMSTFGIASTGTIVYLKNSDGQTIEMGGGSIDAKTNGAVSSLGINRSGGAIRFHENATNTEKVTISSSGSVIIGEGITSTPYKLYVSGNTRLNGSLDGLESLKMGEFSGGDILTISKISADYRINSTDTLYIQDTGDLRVNTTTHLVNGKIGVGIVPTATIHTTGDVRIQTDLDVDKNLTVSDELYVDHANNKVYLGATSTNGIGTDIEINGNVSIKKDADSGVYGLLIQDDTTNKRVSISESSIDSLTLTTPKVLGFQQNGGGICIHGNVTDKTKAISVTDSGSLVIGRNLCNGDVMHDTDNKFEVHGKIYLSQGIQGLKDLQLGDADGGTYFSIDRRPSDDKFHFNAWTDVTRATPDRLFIQDLGLDTVFNNGASIGGNPSNYVHITDAGNVGIGMLNPSSRLQVDGDASISGRVNANYDLVVESNLYIDADTVSTMSDGDTLYISRELTGKSKAGNVVISANSDTDSQTVRISETGKMSLGSSVGAWANLAERLRVVGNTVYYSADPATTSTYTSLSIVPSTTGKVDFDISNGSTLNINCDAVANHTIINGGGITGGVNANTGRLIIGSMASLFDDAANNIGNTSGNFKIEATGPSLFTHNLTTTNGDTQKNFMTDTEILRVRRTAEEYVRFGGDFIQGVKGKDNDSDIRGASRKASILRVQPYGGKVQIGDSTTATTTTTLTTRGVIEATTFDGTATQALYADLAERYQSDIEYPTGTILCHGGSFEVTAGSSTSPIAGVVSDAPAFRMNDDRAYRPETLTVEKMSDTSLDVETIEIADIIRNKIEEYALEGQGRKYRLRITDVNDNKYTVNVVSINVRTIEFDTAITADFTEADKGFDWPMLALKGRLPVRLNGAVTKGQVIVVDSNGKGKGVNFSSYPSNPHLVVGIAINNSYTIDVPNPSNPTETITEYWVEVKV